MLLRVLRRIAWIALLLALVFACSRGIIRLLPGDPVETLLAESGSAVSADVLRAEFGLDKPYWSSVFADGLRALHGDFGRSILSHQTIAPLLRDRFLATLRLALLSMTLGVSVALALGLAAAPGNGGGPISRWADRICSFQGALAAALPVPWIGPLMILIFSVRLDWFPLGGHVALPAITLAIPFAGVWARLIRERVRESLRLGAAPGARARGIPEIRVLWKYGLIPVAGPLLAYLGTQFGVFLSSGFVAEVIFNYAGMGSLLVDAVLSRDYPVVESTVFIGAACALMGTWLGDLLQTWVDPRLVRS